MLVEKKLFQSIIIKTHTIRLLRLHWGYSAAKLDNSFVNYEVLKKNKTLFEKSFLYKDFKMTGRKNEIVNILSVSSPKKSKMKLNSSTNTKLLRSFKTFLVGSMSTSHQVFTPHSSFASFYVTQKKGGASIINLGKFFQKWKLSYYLFYNLFYYKIYLLTFTSSFFKKEALAFNWSECRQFEHTWRYIKPFLFLKPNKINDSAEFIFRKLKYLQLNTALITDISYHQKTIYYLKRLNYFTLGLVPTLYHLKSVDFAIPVASESLLNQVYFVRFILSIKQNSLRCYSTNLKTLDNNF